MPSLEVQELDMLENDLIGRMAHASSFREWWDLARRRDALRLQREAYVQDHAI